MLRKLRKIKKKPLFFLLALLVIGTVGGTIAFFTSSVTYANIFQVSKYNVVIEEKFNNEFGTKEVNFVNQSKASSVIRINYNEFWSRVVGEDKIILNNLVAGTNLVTKSWTTAFLNDFTYRDGWYYYNKVLKENSSVQVLTAISLNEALLTTNDLKEEYHNADYELDFNLESVQASTQAIKSVWNRNATITGDDVSWDF